jgi:hypothetical protein
MSGFGSEAEIICSFRALPVVTHLRVAAPIPRAYFAASPFKIPNRGSIMWGSLAHVKGDMIPVALLARAEG